MYVSGPPEISHVLRCAATRLVRGGQNNRIPVLTVPTLAACAYACWKELTAPFTIALMIGQVGTDTPWLRVASCLLPRALVRF
jgi:hypothetical protein